MKKVKDMLIYPVVIVMEFFGDLWWNLKAMGRGIRDYKKNLNSGWIKVKQYNRIVELKRLNKQLKRGHKKIMSPKKRKQRAGMKQYQKAMLKMRDVADAIQL